MFGKFKFRAVLDTPSCCKVEVEGKVQRIKSGTLVV